MSISTTPAVSVDQNRQPLAWNVYQQWLEINQGLLAETGQADLIEAIGALDKKIALLIGGLASLEEALAMRTGSTLAGLPMTPDGQLVIAVKEDPDGEGPDIITL